MKVILGVICDFAFNTTDSTANSFAGFSFPSLSIIAGFCCKVGHTPPFFFDPLEVEGSLNVWVASQNSGQKQDYPSMTLYKVYVASHQNLKVAHLGWGDFFFFLCIAIERCMFLCHHHCEIPGYVEWKCEMVTLQWCATLVSVHS